MRRHIRFIFLASFFFSLHMALLAYVNSSMLSGVVSATAVGITYTVASILSLILVSIAPDVIRRIGALWYIGVSLVLSASLLYLISSHTGISIIPLFILYFSLNSVILYGLDIFLEHYSAESNTGNIRGAYLTLSNIGWVIAPLLSGTLQERVGFSGIYLAAASVLIITLITIFFGQRGFVDKAYPRSTLADGIRVLRKNKNLRLITSLNFLLQLFFVVMVIYSPVYLIQVLGFSWQEFSLVLSIMLSAFVILPYPLGKIVDKYKNEKELMSIALLLMGAATLYFARLGYATVTMYALVLFLSRVGASTLETMCESAFFKQVTDSDSEVISVYRNMMPFAYTIGPLIAAALFAFTSYQTLFTVLGIVMLLSVFLAIQIKDVR
jgi:predicted MFS family arabinose efflux permease